MSIDAVEVSFSPRTLMESDVRSLRMIRVKGVVYIVLLNDLQTGVYQLSAIEFNRAGNAESSKLLALESPYGMPQWDILSKQDQIATVSTEPGSGICPLVFNRTGVGESRLTNAFPGGVFQGPRFLKGGGLVAISTISLEERGASVALFKDNIESEKASYTLLPSTKSGIPTDSLLLKCDTGYLLFYTRFAVSGIEGEHRCDENLQSGHLFFLQLDDAFQVIGKSQTPIGDTLVYEFDADISENEIFLFATTYTGYISARATINNDTSMWDVSDNIILHNTLSSGTTVEAQLVCPSVLISDSDVYISAIDNSLKQENTRLLTSKMAI